MQQAQFVVPPNVQPGSQITINVNGQHVDVVLPPDAVPGSSIAVQVPSVVQATVVQPVAPAPVAQPAMAVAQPVAPIAPVAPVSTSQYTSMQQQLLSGQSATVPMGRPVHEVMPNLPSSQADQFSGYQYTTEVASEAGMHHAAEGHGPYADATAAMPMGVPVYYTDAELATLSRAPLPADGFVAATKGSVAPDQGPQGAVPMAEYYTVAPSAAVAVGSPILTTSAGVPVLNTSSAVSGAETHLDGWNGIKSCDARLQRDASELMLFFNTHNSRPLLGCKLEGWHHETRHRRRRVDDGNGKSHTVTETYVVRVTDFHYKIDLSQFIFPYGYIASVDENNLTVPELIEKYIKDDNLLKSLEMKKVVLFDFNSLRAMVYGYMRSIGWRRGLTVSFPKANHTVRVYKQNWLSSLWENCCINLLCHLTIVPCIIMRIYRGDCCCSADHAEADVRSFFKIQYHPSQVFEAIRPQLWCPGFSGSALAMELLRDIFW